MLRVWFEEIRVDQLNPLRSAFYSSGPLVVARIERGFHGSTGFMRIELHSQEIRVDPSNPADPRSIPLRVSQLRVVPAVGAGATQRPAIAHHFSAVVDALAALLAKHPRDRAAWLVFDRDIDLDSLDNEQFVIRQLLVCIQLTRVPVLYIRERYVSSVPRRVAGYYPDRLACFRVQKRGCELSVIIVLEGALAQPASGDRVDRVRGAAVDL